MKKLLGYIPLEKDEDRNVVAKETDVICIENNWYKMAEVWVPGVAMGTDLWEKTHFRPKEGEERTNGGRCENCGKFRAAHKGPDSQCPPKNKLLTGD